MNVNGKLFLRRLKEQNLIQKTVKKLQKRQSVDMTTSKYLKLYLVYNAWTQFFK